MLSESHSPKSDLEHSRLRKALRESELLRELSELLASSLDPTRILQVLVKRTTEVCDVDRCAVWLLDGDQAQFLPSAYHLSTQNLKGRFIQTADHTWHHSRLPFNHPIVHQIFNEDGWLVLENLQTEESMRTIAEKFFVRSVLLVALIRENRPVGVMSLDNFGRTTNFTPEQQQLARVIGQQAAVAIDNARLYQEAQEERKRAEHLIERAQSIYQVAMAVNSGADLATVLTIASEHLVRILNAQGAVITLLEKEALTLMASVYTPNPHPWHSTIIPSEIHFPPLASLPQCEAIAKIQAPQFITCEQVTSEEKMLFKQLGMSHILIVPLLVGTNNTADPTISKTSSQKNRCVGFAFINYTHPGRAPSSGQFAFAQDIAAHCAMAIEKATILAQARQAVTLATEKANTLDAVFNAMTEGLIVLDQQGKVIISNNTASRFFGLTRNARRQLSTYLQQHPAYTLAGDRIPVEDFPLTRALHGETVRGERFMNKSGDDHEHSIEVNIAPLYNSEKEQIGIVSAFRDITEQVKAERRIRRALDTMLHAAEAVSGVTDIREILSRVLTMTLTALNCERGVVQRYNQEQQAFQPLVSIGFELDEVDTWLQAQHYWFPAHLSADESLQNRLLEGHALPVQSHTTNSLQQNSGLAIPITHNKHLLGVMMLDRNNTSLTKIPPSSDGIEPQVEQQQEFSIWDMAVVEGIAQFAGLAIEQTRWQQEAEIARTNEATMRESNALKDEFLAITAHEFRTPLTVILAHSQMMARILKRTADMAPELKERLNESIAFIEEQTRQLTNIVNTFLEVTRLNRGQLELAQELINLEEIIKEVVAYHGSTTTLHRISYQLTPTSQAYRVVGDRARLQQIFTNLVQNAIKYSPKGGPITIKLTQKVNYEMQKIIEISIKDRGIGIPKDAQQYLFERFYRAPNASNSRARGVGLGLYLVAELLHLHKGTIRVESSGIEGEGSRFILTLPLKTKGELQNSSPNSTM